ncbi:MYND-type domain-containing protein [Mycena chlorophos]|uniref:MYND-type domain-containing protein n=1 Tax=Mycena chlorophos TaxID=658473 RepID=A0A8H6S640_MYCCL|nr:MYND-type domain-containing protein [Mycena chlorophos]
MVWLFGLSSILKRISAEAANLPFQCACRVQDASDPGVTRCHLPSTELQVHSWALILALNLDKHSLRAMGRSKNILQSPLTLKDSKARLRGLVCVKLRVTALKYGRKLYLYRKLDRKWLFGRTLTATSSEISRCDACHRPGGSRPPYLVPVYFAALDPAKIPALRLFENWNDATSAETFPVRLQVALALACFEGFPPLCARSEVVPPAALVDLWKRVWPWIEFFDSANDQLTRLIKSPATLSALPLLHTLWLRLTNDDIKKRTPGPRAVIARLWRHVLFDQNRSSLDLVLVCELIDGSQMGSSHNNAPPLDEFVAGAGGTWDDFAQLLIAHLKLSTPSRAVTQNENGPRRFVALRFVLSNGFSSYEALQEALTHRRYGRVLTQTLRSLPSSLEPSDFSRFLPDAFRTLSLVFLYTQRRSLARQSLRGGLIPLIIEYGRHDAIPDLMEPIETMLTEDLPAFTVYPEFLRRLHVQMEEYAPVVAENPFRNEDIGEAWGYLKDLVEERLVVLDGADKRRPCHNIRCPNIGEAICDDRCADCQTAYYCSRRCQRQDWRHHKLICEELWRIRREDGGDTEGCSLADEAFFRALLDEQYAVDQPDIFTQLLPLLRAAYSDAALNAGDELPVPLIKFDFSAGECEVTASLVSQPMEIIGSCHLSEARRRGGTMWLHAMGVGVEDTVHWRVFPLWCATSEVADRLERLARMPASAEADRAAIEEMVDLDIGESH